MKKVLIIIICVLLIFSAVACGITENSKETVQKTLPVVTVNENNKFSAYSVELASEENELAAEYVENVDYKYYVYYFYLGLINQVPSYSSIALKYSYDTEVSVKFGKLTEESFSDTVSKYEEVIDTHSRTSGFEIGLQQEVSAVFATVKAKLSANESTDHHWTDNWGKTINESNATTSSYLEHDSKEFEEKVTFSEEAGFVKGNYYRVTFYETVKAYGVLIYDVEENTYTPTSQTFLKGNSTVRMWEESPSPVFEYEKSETLDFDVEKAILYAQNNPPSAIEPDQGNENLDNPKTQKISVIMNRYNCNDGNNYNKNEPEESEVWRSRHDGYEIGQLNLYGCQQMGSDYRVCEPDKFAVRYEVLQNSDDLPRVGTKITHIQNDTAKNVVGTNIDTQVGYGAYWVRITYTDDSQNQYSKTNILKNATNGTIIDIVTQDNIDKTKSIQRIDVVVAYEIYGGGPGVLGKLGIWWHEYTNWRCEYTYIFN